MIHFSVHVKLVELKTLQVIVGSYGQNAILEETMKSSQPEFCLPVCQVDFLGYSCIAPLPIGLSQYECKNLDRDVKLIFMPPKELWEAYSNRTVHPSVCPSRFRVQSISPIFFEVGIPNLVCGYILGWRSVMYHFRVTVTLTLTSDLVFRIIVSGAYLLYYLR